MIKLLDLDIGDCEGIFVVDEADIPEVETYGWPWILRVEGLSDQQLLGMLMLGILREHFPHIDWLGYFGLDKMGEYVLREKNIIVHVPGNTASTPSGVNPDSEFKSPDRIVDIAIDDRTFEGSAGTESPEGEVNILDFLDPQTYVDVEKLQSMELLPHFMSDIVTCISKNLSVNWTEGYNKKLRVPVGNFNGGKRARNLIILDISGSIPDGISATMLSIIDGMRHRCEADLIITANHSKYWSLDDDLPKPSRLRMQFGYGNEAFEFEECLIENVLGKDWDNVIVFGDNDNPMWYSHNGASFIGNIEGYAGDMKVGKLWSYHTRMKATPGYARWATELGIVQEEERDTEWARFVI